MTQHTVIRGGVLEWDERVSGLCRDFIAGLTAP